MMLDVLDAPPGGCTCSWTTSNTFGSLYHADERCPARPHPRRWVKPLHRLTAALDGRGRTTLRVRCPHEDPSGHDCATDERTPRCGVAQRLHDGGGETVDITFPCDVDWDEVPLPVYAAVEWDDDEPVLTIVLL